MARKVSLPVKTVKIDELPRILPAESSMTASKITVSRNLILVLLEVR